MPKTQIVIDIEGGIVSIYSSYPDNLDVILVDWDNDADPHSTQAVEVPAAGPFATARVLDLLVQPLIDLPGTPTEQAIDIAYEQGALAERGGVPC